MKTGRLVVTLSLITLIFGCSGVTDKDLQNLSSENLAAKRAALQAIANKPFSLKALAGFKKSEKKAARVIQTLLTDKASVHDVELNLLGLAALGRLAEDVEVPVSVFLRKLQSDDPRIRTRAVEVLGKMGSSEAILPLIRMSAQDTENYAVIWALGEIGGPEAVSFLNQLLASDDEYVRYNAYNALSKVTSSPKNGVEKDKQGETARISIEKNVLTPYKNAMSILFRKIGLLKKTWS